MSKFGLYAVNEQKKAGSSTWNLSRLYHDGKDIATVSDPDSFGLRSVDSKLNLGGSVIAESEDVHPNLGVDNGDIKFGDDVSLGTGKCINITLDDFNILLQGGSVSGYTKYNPSACYNIVDDVATAEEVTWQPSEYDLNDPVFCKHYHIYNNIVGMDDVYEEYGGPIDALHPVNTFTAISTKDPETGEIIDAGCPQLGFHYFNNVIEPADTLHIQFHIDTHHMAFFEHSRLGRKFTVYVKDESGELLGQKTVYAGIIRMDLRLPSDANFADGYHWFSIQAVDDRGVGSVVQFFDFKVKTNDEIAIEAATNPETRATHNKIYEMSSSDLTKFGIKRFNEPDYNYGGEEQDYRNKLGFSLLFNAVKNTGYDGIRIYNSKTDGNNDIYNISYKKNRRNLGLAGKELNGFRLNESTDSTQNIFNDITLYNASNWYKTVGSTTYHLTDCPVDIGGFTYFLLHIYEDPSYFEDGVLKSRYVRTYAIDSDDKYVTRTSVVYDTEEEEFVCIRKYRIAPLIAGCDVKWVGNQDSVIEGTATYTAYNPPSGFLKYYHLHIDDISDGSIETGLATIISNASSADSYTANGEPLSIPEGVDVAEWIYKDEAHVYRDSSDSEYIKTIWGSNISYPAQVKWDLGNDTPKCKHVTSGYLQTKSFWAFVHHANGVTNVKNYLKTTEKVGGVYKTGTKTLNPWQNSQNNGGKARLQFQLDYPDDDYSARGDRIYYITGYNQDWGTDGYKGGSYMKIPSNFTIDLNDVTFRGTGDDDLRRDGRVMSVDDVINVHIKNGKFDGNLANHNWIKSAIRIDDGGSPVEQFGTISESNSKYVSFENMEITGTLGYEGGSTDVPTMVSTEFGSSMTEPGYLSFSINNDQETLTEISDDGLDLESIDPNRGTITDKRRAKLVNGELAEENLITSEKEPCVGLIHSSSLMNLPTISDTVVDDLMITPNGLGAIDAARSGKRPEVFLHLFNGSTYKTTIKTKWYNRIRIPSGVTKFKVTGYGVTVKENGSRTISMSYKSDKTPVPQGFYSAVLFNVSDGFTRNVRFKNVTWTDTRTIAVQVNGGGTTAFDSCKFIGASRVNGYWSPNPHAVDLEESQKLRSDVSFVNCDVLLASSEGDAEKYPFINTENQQGWYGGSRSLLSYACKNLNIVNTSGFLINDYGGMTGSCILNSELAGVNTVNSYYYANPCNIYVDTTVGVLHGVNHISSRINFPGGDAAVSANKIYNNGTNTYKEPNRTNRDDDPVPERIGTLGLFGTALLDNVCKLNAINGSIKNTSGKVIAEHISSSFIYIYRSMYESFLRNSDIYSSKANLNVENGGIRNGNRPGKCVSGLIEINPSHTYEWGPTHNSSNDSTIGLAGLYDERGCSRMFFGATYTGYGRSKKIVNGNVIATWDLSQLPTTSDGVYVSDYVRYIRVCGIDSELEKNFYIYDATSQEYLFKGIEFAKRTVVRNITMHTQCGQLRSGLTGNFAKYNGFPEKLNGSTLGDVNITTIRQNLNNYCHTVRMIDITDCKINHVNAPNGSTLSIFCYDDNGKLLTSDGVVSDVSKIPHSAKYVKFQLYSADGYLSLPYLTVSVTGTPKVCKNSVPELLKYIPFRFETRIPVTAEAVSACLLPYNADTRCVDTGVVVMPNNYSINGTPVPLVIFCHGSTEGNDFVSRSSTGEHFMVSEFLAKNGYAVADCSGITDLYYNEDSTDYYKGEGIGALSYSTAIKNLVSYLLNNYNIRTDGVYLSCKSIGGIVTSYLAATTPFKINAVGMIAPALSPTISAYNHAQKLTDGANMEIHQLGINYSFTANSFTDTDETSILNNISKWRQIDGFFIGTDVSDVEMGNIVENSHSYRGDTTSGLVIGDDSVVPLRKANWDTLIQKNRTLTVPVKIWISSGDKAVFYSNSQLYVKMAENGGSDCVLETMPSMPAYGNISASTESHNVCTIAHNTERVYSDDPEYAGVVIDTFNNQPGVPKGLAQLVKYFNEH